MSSSIVSPTLPVCLKYAGNPQHCIYRSTALHQPSRLGLCIFSLSSSDGCPEVKCGTAIANRSQLIAPSLWLIAADK